jgi:hypothetical protein
VCRRLLITKKYINITYKLFYGEEVAVSEKRTKQSSVSNAGLANHFVLKSNNSRERWMSVMGMR